jgi:hypothetical protein
VPARLRGLRAGRRGNAEAVIPGWTGAGSRISSQYLRACRTRLLAEEAGEERN